ncbi:MAG: type I glyceraldehyde-3-phosphate dehydrogenase, partial [Bdellovibrionales bacterium]
MAKLRVGINGFGRIGRVFFRAGFDKLDIVGINDLTDAATLAHLLKYDSSHGTFPYEVKAEGQAIIVNGKRIPVSATKNPAEIPWKSWGAEMIAECTGAFKKREDFLKHLDAGAQRVLVSAPADGIDTMLVYGVNHESYAPDKHKIVSNASCTTNCLTPVVKVLHDKFQIVHGLMTTVHSYTNDQNILDAPHKDLRRARSAALSMIPTTTGAAKAVGKVLPELAGKIDGTSIRVPTPNVSLVDFVATTQKPVTVEAINEAFQQAANSSLKGVLRCEANELVSHDFNGDPASSIVDLPSTMVSGPNLLKVFS